MLIKISRLLGRIADQRSATIAAGIAVLIVFACFSLLVDLWAWDLDSVPGVQAGVRAAILGTGAGLSVYLLLVTQRERRQAIRNELIRLADLNHRFRNHLEVIAGACYFGPDDARKTMLLDTVAAMEQVLRQLYPAAGCERREHDPVPLHVAAETRSSTEKPKRSQRAS